tara:strand:+ start:3082 stop:3774 length:693 start_codon:yes stop_codon:yes gene_type:complete
LSKIAIIPARGGSKRIPRKNIRDFMGRPIIAYSILTALESDLFDEVMVSTDDEEIAEIARSYGAKVPFMRTNENSNDYATTLDVIIEVIDWYKKNKRYFDFGCCLYPTSPLTTTNHLIEGLHLLISKNQKSVFPVTKFNYPIWRGLSINENGNVSMIWPEYLSSRSQDLKETYHDAGQWYWFQVSKVVNEKSLFTDNSTALKLPETEVQDIDTETDWEIAELKFKLLNSK